MAIVILHHAKARTISASARVITEIPEAGLPGFVSLEIQYGAERVSMTFPPASAAWAEGVAAVINTRTVHPANPEAAE